MGRHDRKLLLIRHKTLNDWLLPGGHVEPGDSQLIYAALSELEEETGISCIARQLGRVGGFAPVVHRM